MDALARNAHYLSNGFFAAIKEIANAGMNIFLAVSILMTFSHKLCGQEKVTPVMLSNMKALYASYSNDDYDCNHLVLYYDLTVEDLYRYSSVEVKSEAYVASFGEYELRPHGNTRHVIATLNGEKYLNGIRYDSSKGAYFLEWMDCFMLVRGDAGISYSKNGERDEQGKVQLDDSGRIISFFWARQGRTITYTTTGLIETITKGSDKNTVIWKNSILSEITQNFTYGKQEQTHHFWYEIIDKDENGHWITIDMYKQDAKGQKMKDMRFTRTFKTTE